MSKRDFDKYFQQVFSQYVDMVDTLHELEDLCNKKLIAPERLDDTLKLIEPLKNNYMALAYVKFLLNKPSKKEKEKRYKDQNKKQLSKLDIKRSPSGIKQENQQVINNLKTQIQEAEKS